MMYIGLASQSVCTTDRLDLADLRLQATCTKELKGERKPVSYREQVYIMHTLSDLIFHYLI